MRMGHPTVKDNGGLLAPARAPEHPLFQALSPSRGRSPAVPPLPCVKALARLGFRTIFKLKLRPRSAAGQRGSFRSMQSIGNLIDTVIWLYTLVLIVHVVLSWLTAFNVVNTRHPFVNAIGRTTYRLCEPVLSKIRRFLPNLGGLDISPIILILLLYFVRNLINEYIIYPATM
jgi:YggT family protein